MKSLKIPPIAPGLQEAADRAGHRAQGDEPHKAAAEGVRVSSDWQLFADGQPVPVYAAPVTRGGPHSFAQVSFAGDEPVLFTAIRDGGAKKAELLPTSYGLIAALEAGRISFSMAHTGHVTVLADDSIDQPLTISVCSIREEKKPEEVQGLYFGPGLHQIDTFDFEDGDTVYLAAGAVVTAMPHPAEEKPLVEKDWAGQPIYRTCLMADGKKNIRLEGQGMLDFSLLHWHERNPAVFKNCKNVTVQDVTIVNVPAWTLHFSACEGVEVDNVKLYGYRENSDGIDIVSSQQVRVRDCFIRTGDDAVVVKAMVKPPVCGGRDILAERCVVWNDKVRCFGIAAESVNDISDVTFRNCDVIRSYADWTLELGSLVVYICDKALVSNVVFDDIRIEHECHLATHVMITKDFWSKDEEAGNIRDVVFRNIQVKPAIGSRVAGYGPENTVRGVRYENISIADQVAQTLAQAGIAVCDYAYDVTMEG